MSLLDMKRFFLEYPVQQHPKPASDGPGMNGAGRKRMPGCERAAWAFQRSAADPDESVRAHDAADRALSGQREAAIP